MGSIAFVATIARSTGCLQEDIDVLDAVILFLISPGDGSGNSRLMRDIDCG